MQMCMWRQLAFLGAKSGLPRNKVNHAGCGKTNAWVYNLQILFFFKSFLLRPVFYLDYSKIKFSTLTFLG